MPLAMYVFTANNAATTVITHPARSFICASLSERDSAIVFPFLIKIKPHYYLSGVGRKKT
jgi:hypothetical protein